MHLDVALLLVGSREMGSEAREGWITGVSAKFGALPSDFPE